MAKKSISLESKVDVLISETQILQAANKHVKEELVPNIRTHVNQIHQYANAVNEIHKEIKQTKVQVDPKAITELLTGKQIVKQWQQITFVVMSFIAVVAVGAAFWFYSEYDEMTKARNYWYEVAVEQGYESKQSVEE